MDPIEQPINPPLISIALCTYNGEKFLEKQLQSILSQTYSNLEVVIVDDQSTDGTEEIVLEFSKADPRIKFFKNPENLGFNKNFEKAISLSKGEYIAISDQDDIWNPEKISMLFEHIGDNWVIFSNSALVNEQEVPTGENLIEQVDLDHLQYKSFLFINHVTGHTSLLRREFLKYYLPIPEQGYYDWWMGFIAAYHEKIIFIDKILTKHRIHSQSVVQQKINTNFDKNSRGIFNYNLIKQHLNNFLNYNRLKDKDRAFLQEYDKAFKISSNRFSLPLYWFYLKNFDDIHLNRKNKSLLSKLNFLRKISGPFHK